MLDRLRRSAAAYMADGTPEGKRRAVARGPPGRVAAAFPPEFFPPEILPDQVPLAMSDPITAAPRNVSIGRALTFVVPFLIVAAWWWIGRPVEVPPSPLAAGEKVACLSYAPFEGWESPFDPGRMIPPEQIDRHFAALAAVTDCLRTYSVGQGLDVAPEMARKHGLKLLLGVWLGRNRAENAAELEKAVALGKAYPDVIRAIVVGNEVLLRRDLPIETLREAIRTVRAGAGVPVTYADVWEFWERNPELKDEVDFVTVHILPYWEDDPIGVVGARDHVEKIRRHMGELFAGKEILIGETGWPSAGRMREDALPSPSNQVAYLSEIIALSKANGWDYNLIEAKDQPWKRRLEGTVGGHWGVLDDALGLKFAWGAPISDQPSWPLQAIGGLLAAIVVIGVGGRSARERTPVRLAALALVAGVALPWWVVEIPLISLDAWDWLFAASTLALSAALAVLGARALAKELDRPAFATLLGGSAAPRPCLVARALGWGVLVAAAILAATLVALLVDSRYRDFQTAAFALPAIVALVVPPALGAARAERFLAILMIAAAVGVAVHETFQNTQALAFVAVALVFALALRPWRASLRP